MLITDLITADRIAVGLAVPNKSALLELLAEQAARASGIPAPTILAALLKREALGSTGIGQSIAMPHASLPELERPVGYLMVLSQPVDFAAVDDEPVDIVVLLLTPENRAEHLQALSLIARVLRVPRVQAALRSATTAEGAHAALSAG
jgi:PTS system nitrogen regulatory IIA component